MRRLLLIAAREYLSFLRTPGFWLSLLLAPLGGVLGGAVPAMMAHNAAPRTLAIVDLTGGSLAPGVEAALARRHLRLIGEDLRQTAASAGGPDAARAVATAFETGGEAAGRAKLAQVAPKAAARYRSPSSDILLTPPPPGVALGPTPAAAGAALKPYIAGQKLLPYGGHLDTAAVLARGPQGGVVVDLWTKNFSDSAVNDAVQTAVGEAEHSQAMREAGLSPAVIAAIDQATPQVRTYSPKVAGGRVSMRDRLPAIVGFGLGFLLWMVVLTSTTLLLNSVIEEKSNRVLEVLMSSASIPEILGGKILGVAWLAATVLVVWGVMGSIALNRFAPGMTGDILQAVLSRGLIVYFALYFIGGYLMYASIFAAIGAFCETVREAQTLVGPLMMLLIVPIMFMSMTITRPDAPMLDVLSWIPPFTPFLMAARVASGPPLWEILGTLVVMFATAALVVWLSARAFRAGALSTAKLDRKRLFASLLRASRA